MKPTLDESVRAAFDKHSCPFDRLRSDDLIRDGAYEIYFKADLHTTVISLAVNKSGVFKVAGSSSVPTADFEAYLMAYGRSLAFAREAGLQPKTS